MTRVLIADDHPFILAGLTAILHNSEFEVITSVTNGAEALAALPRWKPDILVVDVAMPVRTGMDVLRELRKRGDPLKIVLLTASLDSQQVAEAIELQADGVVLKEGAQHLLLECLRSVKDGRQWLQPELAQKVALQAQRKDPLTGLAPRERAIVRLLETGKRNREIAEDLGTTEGTVKVYLHRIYEKLGVGNRTELALLAKQER